MGTAYSKKTASECICGGVLTMDRLPVGIPARISGLDASGELRRRLIELGFFEGERVIKVLESPLGDPSGYLVRGAVTAIRNADAKKIIVSIAYKNTDAAERGEEGHKWV